MISMIGKRKDILCYQNVALFLLGTLRETRTPGPLLRRQMLYPTEL